MVERARKPFPIEPLRALDAIHLASALIVVADVPECSLLTFDQRIREAAREMGLTITPATSVVDRERGLRGCHTAAPQSLER